MSDNVKLAIVGCGGISNAHIKAYRALYEKGCRDFELVACCDPNQENATTRAKEIAEWQGSEPRLFTSVEELVKAEAAQAADVCTPHAFHHSSSIPLLEGGMDVLLEKPLGITVKASKKIIGAAKEAGRVLATAENTRRSIGSRACRWAICEAGMIGKPLAAHIQAIFNNQLDFEKPLFKWRGVKLLTGGGMIMDSGAHFADMQIHMFGDVDEVSCIMHTHDPAPIKDVPMFGDANADVEDTWHVVIRFKSGMYTTWTYSRVFPGEGGKVGRYYGTKGSMEDCGFSFHCFEGGGKLKLEDGSEKTSDQIKEEYMASLSEEQKEHLFPYGLTGGFEVEVYDFVRAIKTGKPVEMDGEAGLRAKALCEACYESATAGTPVKYQDVLDGKISAFQDPIDEYWKV